MEAIRKEAFKVIGIKTRTTNENEQASQDIPALWGRFMDENVALKIPNKTDNSIFSIYTNYEGDYMKPYDTILACEVSSLDDIPEGMVGMEIEASDYQKFSAEGDLSKGVVYNEWINIWNSNLNRKYSADFEIYGAEAQNREAAQVDIFVSVR